jgi:ATP-dependent RNA helicase DeaD
VVHVVAHHDVVESDVAAALAIVAQGDTPLLLSADDLRPPRVERERRDDRPSRDGDDRGERRARPARGSGNMATYRIDVGRRHRVEPRQIVGALANEGGFSREDFGHIDIRPDFSLVELPVGLSQDKLDRLSGTQINGRPIDIRVPPSAGRPRSVAGASRATDPLTALTARPLCCRGRAVVVLWDT